MSTETNREDYLDLIGAAGCSVPFLMGGRTLAGMDCLGVCLEMARRRGIPLEDPWERIADRWHAGVRDRSQLSEMPPGWRQVDDGLTRTNDLILFSLCSGARVASHAGWVIAPGMVISAIDPAGVCCSPLHRMLDRVVEVWRYEP